MPKTKALPKRAPRPKLVKTVINANDLATILASLRMFQRNYDGVDAKDFASIDLDFFTHDDGALLAPLSTPDIDDLCEQINTSQVIEIDTDARELVEDVRETLRAAIKNFNFTTDGDSNDAEHDAALTMRDAAMAVLAEKGN